MGTVALTDAVTGTQISSATFNSNNSALESALNGGIDDANLESSKIITGTTHFKQDGATNLQVYAYDAVTDNRWEPTSITSFLVGKLLGVVSYDPTTVTTTTTTSTTGADVDATNLILAITIPVGGTKILVRFDGTMGNGNSQELFWGLRESTNNIAYNKVSSAALSVGTRVATTLLVTGLSAGAHSYKWAQKSRAGTATGIQYGTQASPAANDPGPAIMSIWEVV